MEPIAIFTTGGTIDKIYFDAKGGYEVGAPVVRQVLEHARADAALPVTELLRKDSLAMTAADREHIRAAVAQAPERRIIVTHGTDTMVETARALLGLADKVVVLTGALQPGRFSDSDAPFNLGMALAAVQLLPPGVYVAASGRVFDARRVRKNLAANRFEDPPIEAAADKPALYRALAESYAGLIDGERDFIANAANLAALLYATLPELNWAGCYLLRGGELVLGPFQGKPACVRIALGRGVCGAAAELREALIVPDVHVFPGHIACDAASRSELVVPVLRGSGGSLLGVFDLDSPRPARFDSADRDGIVELVGRWIRGSDLPGEL